MMLIRRAAKRTSKHGRASNMTITMGRKYFKVSFFIHIIDWNKNNAAQNNGKEPRKCNPNRHSSSRYLDSIPNGYRDCEIPVRCHNAQIADRRIDEDPAKSSHKTCLTGKPTLTEKQRRIET